MGIVPNDLYEWAGPIDLENWFGPELENWFGPELMLV